MTSRGLGYSWDCEVRSVTKPTNSEEVAKGKGVLNNYNYHKKLSLSSQPLLKSVGPNFQAENVNYYFSISNSIVNSNLF